MTERLHFHFSLSCIGEGNGNPLQYSRLENARDRGAWWAAVYGVAQSRTQLKRLSSSSSRVYKDSICSKTHKRHSHCPEAALSLLSVKVIDGESMENFILLYFLLNVSSDWIALCSSQSSHRLKNYLSPVMAGSCSSE